ncbi:MAG: hypothetical protein PGN12_06115 [Sphingomonas phyllosphaerae]
MTPRRDQLALPLAIVGVLLGTALLLLFFVDAPRIALAVVILAFAVMLAVLRELIFPGDR